MACATFRWPVPPFDSVCNARSSQSLPIRILAHPNPHAQVRWLSDSGIIPADGPERQTEAGAFLARHPDLFTMSISDCEERRTILSSFGLNGPQAASVLRAEPSILAQPMDQLDLRAQFFLKVVGASVDELCEVPQMLICDLAKTPMLRHAYCLSNGLRYANRPPNQMSSRLRHHRGSAPHSPHPPALIACTPIACTHVPPCRV